MTRRTRSAGFTLIEFLLILVIFVMLLSIALTSLFHARLASNEANAAAALRTAAVTETSWRQTDADGNGQPDFWTRDWSGLCRVEDAKGQPWRLISEDMARADGAPADATAGEGRPRITASLVKGEAVPYFGYFFRAMTTDNAIRVTLKDGSKVEGEIERRSPEGMALRTDSGVVVVRTEDFDQVASADRPYGPQNKTKFGFTAWPASPGSSGRHVLILVESGAIWARDLDGPGAGGPPPAGCTLMPNARGGQLAWPEPGEGDLTKLPTAPWKSVQ